MDRVCAQVGPASVRPRLCDGHASARTRGEASVTIAQILEVLGSAPTVPPGEVQAEVAAVAGMVEVVVAGSEAQVAQVEVVVAVAAAARPEIMIAETRILTEFAFLLKVASV